MTKSISNLDIKDKNYIILPGPGHWALDIDKYYDIYVRPFPRSKISWFQIIMKERKKSYFPYICH